MSHLTLEDLARLVDDVPGAHEAAHLGTCALCRDELEAMREDVQALATLPDMATAPDGWAALETRLREEGLIRDAGGGRGAGRSAAWPRLLQAAAAIVLFLAGSMAGRLTASGEPALADAGSPAAAAPGAAPVELPPADAEQPAARYAAAEEPTAPPPAAAPVEPAPRNRNVTLASSGFGLSGQPRSMDEAIAQLREAEDLYLSALTRYAEMATRSEPGDPVARLAALQSIVMTTQAALNQAPADPVINGYHLTALASRDATLRQVANATGDRWY
jgi:hypothetical protein